MKKKVLSVVLTATLAFSMTPSAAFAATDTEGHWGQAVLDEWEGYGIIRGYDDGTVRPDAAITRGEMATILDRVMGYQETAENDFSDLSEEDWCMDEMLRAVAAGVFHGDDPVEGEPATVRPNEPITREEAALVVSRVLDLDTENAPESTFPDSDAVSDWADDAVNAMAAAGYVNGYDDDGTFRPQGNITRAEALKILDNVFVNLYQTAGEYTGDVEGSAVVDSDGVVLKDMTISGDLIIAEGVADGHVELDNVTVEGRVIVRGGGENSVVIKGASKIAQLVVDRMAGAVRVAVEDAAEVADVVVSEATDGVRLEGKIGNLNVQGAASVVEVAGAVDEVSVADTAEDAKVTLLEGSEANAVASDAKTATIVIGGTVASVLVSGEGSQLTVSGTVTTVDVAGNDVVVKVEASATVEKVATSASGTKVEGEGEVEFVVAGEGSSDAAVSTEGTKVENNGSGDVAIEGGVVAPGETDTTPGGTTSGGGSTGGVVVPHTHTYVDGVCTANDGAYDPSWAQVSSAKQWNDAMDGDAKGIVVTADFTADAQLKVSRAVTINGNNHVVTAGSWNDANLTSKGDAALVSVTAGSNLVSIKNITLAGAQTVTSGDVKDFGHGLNVYESSNVTLNNVTLENNAAAGMVVASSTVNATGLHTSGNGWGGVNVDKASGANPSDAKFAFDETSTFGEVSEETPKLAVYSDKGGVTVNAPEGWAAVSVSGKTAWAKLFAGGYGAEEKPYLISNAEEMLAAGKVTEKKSYQLTSDIDMTGVEETFTDGYGVADIGYFYGDLNGANHSIKSEKGTDAIFLYAIGGTISNVSFEVNNQCAAYNAVDETFSNVTVSGSLEVDRNQGAFVTYAEPRGGQATLKFVDCVARVEMRGDGGESNYNAVFVGYAYGGSNKTSLEFINCVNEGNLTCGKAAMFLGNDCGVGVVTMAVSGCVNKGTIRSAYAGDNYIWNEYVAVGAHAQNTIILDGNQLTLTENGYKLNDQSVHVSVEGEGKGFFFGPVDESLALTLNDDGTFTIAEASNSDVAYYKVSMSLYALLVDASGTLEGGTMVVSISDQINDTNAGSYTTTMKRLSFVDEKWVDQYGSLATMTTEGSGDFARTCYTLDGVSYYYFGSEADTLATLNGAPKAPQTISLSAYDANGNLLCSVPLGK